MASLRGNFLIRTVSQTRGPCCGITRRTKRGCSEHGDLSVADLSPGGVKPASQRKHENFNFNALDFDGFWMILSQDVDGSMKKTHRKWMLQSC